MTSYAVTQPIEAIRQAPVANWYVPILHDGALVGSFEVGREGKPEATFPTRFFSDYGPANHRIAKALRGDAATYLFAYSPVVGMLGFRQGHVALTFLESTYGAYGFGKPPSKADLEIDGKTTYVDDKARAFLRRLAQ